MLPCAPKGRGADMKKLAAAPATRSKHMASALGFRSLSYDPSE